MNKRFLLAFVLLVSINLSSMAQLLPVKNVPGPEIASLGEYGKVPVSLYTGVTSLPTYQRSVMYYDEHSRKIQTVPDHHLNGSDRDFYSYNSFTGSLINHLHEHVRPAASVLSELYTYSYDSGERLAEVSHKLNNKPEVLLSDNEYNELGQLRTQSLQALTDYLRFVYN